MKMDGKKYDKFAIWSFVLSLTPLFIFLIFMFFFTVLWSGVNKQDPIFNYFVMPIAFLIRFGFLFLILSIIFAIISLYKINKNKKLKGKIYAILGIIISIALIYPSYIAQIMISDFK